MVIESTISKTEITRLITIVKNHEFVKGKPILFVDPNNIITKGHIKAIYGDDLRVVDISNTVTDEELCGSLGIFLDNLDNIHNNNHVPLMNAMFGDTKPYIFGILREESCKLSNYVLLRCTVFNVTSGVC